MGPTMLTTLDSDYSILGPEIVCCVLTFFRGIHFLCKPKNIMSPHSAHDIVVMN